MLIHFFAYPILFGFFIRIRRFELRTFQIAVYARPYPHYSQIGASINQISAPTHKELRLEFRQYECLFFF